MSSYTNETLEEIYQFLNEDSRPDTGQSQVQQKEVDFAKEYGIYTKEQAEEMALKEAQKKAPKLKKKR